MQVLYSVADNRLWTLSLNWESLKKSLWNKIKYSQILIPTKYYTLLSRSPIQVSRLKLKAKQTIILVLKRWDHDPHSIIMKFNITCWFVPFQDILHPRFTSIIDALAKLVARRSPDLFNKKILIAALMVAWLIQGRKVHQSDELKNHDNLNQSPMQPSSHRPPYRQYL